MILEPKGEDEVEGIAREAVNDAVDFVESEIAEDRIKAQRYFDGEVDIGEEEGRSKVVSTKIRDTIRAIKPSLLRVFLSTDRPVEFVPSGPDDVAVAEHATKYINYLFNEIGGYRILNECFHDALLKKVGVAKVYWDTYTKSETFDYSGLNEQEYMAIVNDDNVQVISESKVMQIEIDQMGVEIEMPYYDLKVSYQSEKGKLCVESIPPEEFFVDRNAKSIEDAYVVAHRTEMRVGELVAMGYDFDEVSSLGGLGHSDTFSEVERYERRGYEEDYSDEDVQDPSMRIVAVTEAYMKIDVEGTGIPELYKVLMAGSNYKILNYEPWGEIPFAVFEVDPEPHTFYGRSIADILVNEQDASTAMLRGVLDNIALTNNPRTEMIDGMVNIDDLLNNEIGAVVRVKQAGALRELVVPFVAGQVLPAMQYFDQEIESKTGVTKASSGLSPDALQSTTAAAVSATIQAAAGQVEVIARNLAEGGVRRLFSLMLKLVVENSDEEKMMRQSGQFVPIDPRMWNTDMDVSVNVGLGTGREDQKNMALQQALQMQMQIWQSYGPGNGLVGMTNIRNTLADMLALQGVRNADRYFAPMDPQTEQMLIQQQQQMAQQQGQQQAMDPGMAMVQAEQIKAQQKSQTDMIKLQIEAQKALAEDDRKRDEMDQDLLVKAAEIIGKYGTAVDVERIKAMQAEPRYPQQSPAQAVTGGRF
jgi:hypothetical protein